MINFEAIKNFYPEQVRNNALFGKFILKEYLHLMILDFISTTAYARKIAFIGGTSIRLTKGIDRFSEDLDFDCKSFTKPDFHFLEKKCGITDMEVLRNTVDLLVTEIDLKKKMRDFEYLLLNKSNSSRILYISEFLKSVEG